MFGGSIGLDIDTDGGGCIGLGLGFLQKQYYQLTCCKIFLHHIKKFLQKQF
jgi:hypothetical protein